MLTRCKRVRVRVNHPRMNKLENILWKIAGQARKDGCSNHFIQKKTFLNLITLGAPAEIIFFDNSGTIIKTVQIETRGAGQLEVYSSNLSAGTYSYSLVADGLSVDTKKMMNVK